MGKEKIKLPVGVPESEKEDYERVVKEAEVKKAKKSKNNG